VQYIARMSLLWILRILLVLGMIFSFPAAWSAGLHNTEQEQQTPEIERYERKLIPQVRSVPTINPHVGTIKKTELWEHKTIATTAILPLLSILFQPVIYKFMLRLRLYLLKFTSQLVAFT
jgi:hypothetical protein